MADSPKRTGSCSSESESAGSSAYSSGNSESKCNTLSTRSSHDIYESDDPKSGWLMKRSRVSKKWKKRWFLLRRNELIYGHDQETMNKSIPLDGTQLSDSQVDQKSCVFKLQPQDHNRTFFLQAENDAEQLEWMSAICFAKAASHRTEDKTRCILQ